jgi:DNA-binding winged helix-turn-helix (wHTH) protein
MNSPKAHAKQITPRDKDRLGRLEAGEDVVTVGTGENMRTCRFAPFSLDAATRQLMHNGREVSLSPKAFQLLLLLVANRHRAMSKQELHQSLWPSTFVLETNLASLIAEIRRALDDDATKPRFVRTVHRFGYRFVGQVDEAAGVSADVLAAAKYWLAWELRQMPLTEGANVIGRGTDTAIWIDAPGVSRHHARILIRGDEAMIEDLGSKNGTYVAGQRLTAPRRLNDGDQIRVGSVVVKFRIPGLSAETETAL